MLTGVTFVTADDSSLMRDRNIAVAKKYGMILVGEFTNGADLVFGVKSARPDVALVDIVMKGMTGIKAAEQIRALGFGTKIILITASAQKAVTDVDMGLYDYLLVKPFPDEWFLRAVATSLARGKDPRNAES